jgi:hypothetical protein
MSNPRGVRSQPIRWPTAGDVLFAPSPSGRHTTIQQKPGERLRYMIDGYESAASHLIVEALRKPREDERLIYPIVFLYRHLIELSLKELIETYGPRVGVAPDRKSHGLSELWRKYEQICSGFDVAVGDEAQAHMAAIIAEFDDIDPGSFSFRYHSDKKGKPIDLKHSVLDLARLGDVMRGVTNYFSGAYSALWDRESYMRDFEADQAAEWRAEQAAEWRSQHYD